MPDAFATPYSQMSLELYENPEIGRATVYPEPKANPDITLDADTGELIKHDYHGTLIAQRASDGYVNATAMCKAEGKLFGHYNQLASTKEFLNHLASVIGIPITGLVIVNQGGTPALQGTWVHPDVAIDLAMWLSVEFKSWAIRHLLNWMRGAITSPQAPMNYLDTLKHLVAATEVKQALMLENKAMGEQIELVTFAAEQKVNDKDREIDLLIRESRPSTKDISLTQFVKNTASMTG